MPIKGHTEDCECLRCSAVVKPVPAFCRILGVLTPPDTQRFEKEREVLTAVRNFSQGGHKAAQILAVAWQDLVTLGGPLP